LRDWQWIAACALVVSACGAPDNEDQAGGWIFTATHTGEQAPFLSCLVNVGGRLISLAIL
jgi:hypothetical protein